MYRVDSADNVSNHFSDGDSGTGRLGTVVPADWLNAVQEEIAVVVEGLLGPLNKSDSGQLLAAILALLGRVNTWSALQKFAQAMELSGGNLNLTQATLQAIRKTGGKLQVGTGSDNDLELVRNAAVVLALTAAGVDLKNNLLSNVGLLALQPRSTDPSGPANGTVWYRTDTGRVKMRAGSIDVSLFPDTKLVAGHVRGSDGFLLRSIVSSMSLACTRDGSGVYTLYGTGLHTAVATATIVSPAGGEDRTIRIYPPGTANQLRVETHNADADYGGAADADFMFQAILP